MLKYLVRKIISNTVRNDKFWEFYKKIYKLSRYIEHERTKSYGKPSEQEIAVIDGIIAAHMVRNGPFKGMVYPEIKAFGSCIYPKLIGSYEKELHRIIEEICNRREYTEVLDIGCAEGYYAVGFAMRMPHAKVYAWDTDEEAVRFCNIMARINNVSQRVITGSFCDSKTLSSVRFTGKALIMSDCEGYEKILFTKELNPVLYRHDLLIEVHDFVDRSISSTIIDIFYQTHDIEVVSSIDDLRKSNIYNFPEVGTLDMLTRLTLFAEHRPETMEWFYLRSRSER